MRRSGLGAMLVAVAAMSAGCSTGSPAPSATSASSGSSTTAGSSGTTASTTSTPTSTRSPDTLRAALLAAPDLPQGWIVYTDRPTGTNTVSSQATSSDPHCAAFVELVKDAPNPLPANQAQVEFNGGENFKPPSVVENLQAFPDATAAAAELERQRQVIAACPEVTYTLDGRTSPVTVRTEAAPTLPVPALGLRLTASSGELKGYDAHVVAMQVGDAVVSMTLFKATAEQLASLTNAAATKAANVLKTS